MIVKDTNELKRAIEGDVKSIISDIIGKTEEEIRERGENLGTDTTVDKTDNKLVVKLKIDKRSGETDNSFKERKQALNEIGARSYIIVRRVVAQGYK